MSENVFDNIEAVCKERGISVSALCNAVGIRPSVLGELKHGRTKTITLATAQKIANYLGVSVARIAGEEQSEKEQMLEQFFTPECKFLFDASKKFTLNELKTAVKVAEALKDE